MKFNNAGNAIRDLVFRIAGSQYKDIVAISFCWKSILGNLLSERTILKKIENETLFVAVTNNIWMQELVLSKREIMLQIKRKSGVELNNIIFYLEGNNNKTKNYLRRKRKNG